MAFKRRVPELLTRCLLRRCDAVGPASHPEAARALSTGGAAAAAPPAFVFDIDGVLIRGKQVLPAARRALRKLYSPDGQRAALPVAFLTNGGGVTEAAKAHELSEWLDVHVAPTQVVLSHTPFRSLVPRYQDLPVLVAGRGRVADVARHYGLTKVLTTRQLARAAPAAVSFWAARSAAPAPPEVVEYEPPARYGVEGAPIRAVMVFSDPSDWYLDLQLIIDVVAGGGVAGRGPADVPPGAPPVDVFFSNPDFLWANEHAVPRFGQGAFAACLEALHEKLTGQPLQSKRSFGKPNAEPYRLVEAALEAQALALGLPRPPPRKDALGALLPPFQAIYAVGDNPAADVRGANAAGHPWVSVLVRTGVFAGPPGANCHVDPAHIVVDDVEGAVDAALHRARSDKWHSMR